MRIYPTKEEAARRAETLRRRRKRTQKGVDDLIASANAEAAARMREEEKYRIRTRDGLRYVRAESGD